MIIRISTILEAITTTVLLHNLYGKKYYPDFKTILFVAIDLVIFQGINEGYISEKISPIIYLIIAAYCMWTFNGNIKEMIINVILYIILLGSMQMICITGVAILLPKIEMNVRIFWMNVVLLALCILLERRGKLNKLSHFFQQKDVIIKCLLLLSVGIIIGCVYLVQSMDVVYYVPYLIVCVASVILCILAASWEAYKLKAKEKEAELRMYELYGESFENLLLEIRMRQHEFNNHLSAVFSQHLTCDTYEELVDKQKEYSGQIMSENRYERLLVSGNSILTGFLYGKFVEAEQKGVDVSYKIDSTNLNIKMPNHKVIELVGNLMNNALEAVEPMDNPKMHLDIHNNDKETVIEVMNTGAKLTDEEVTKIFSLGYSGKGRNRGLGLYNVKKMSKEYNFVIICENKHIKDENWISFRIVFKSSPE